MHKFDHPDCFLKFLRDLCRAVGIDPDADPVKSITITATAGDLPRITVERLLWKSPHTPAIVQAVAESGIQPEIVVSAPNRAGDVDCRAPHLRVESGEFLHYRPSE